MVGVIAPILSDLVICKPFVTRTDAAVEEGADDEEDETAEEDEVEEVRREEGSPLTLCILTPPLPPTRPEDAS